MEEIKKVVNVLLDNFAKEEQGNRVTSNNMFALATKINQALDGQITLTPPKEEKPEGKE
jgi:1,6-anhydro-N-acetylmuramate kinase